MDINAWPPFEQALETDGVLGALLSGENSGRLDEIAAKYNAIKPDAIKPLRKPAIPKIIHQIWLGGPVPKKLEALSKSWRSRHPDWDYRLWTDADVKEFEFGTRDLFEQANCWGQKSDLLRAEILNRFGGMYVDFDYINYRGVNVLAENYDFFGTLRNIFLPYLGWPDMWKSPVIACNSLFGAKPGHPILDSYLKLVREVWDREDLYKFSEDELPKTAIMAMGGVARATRIKETASRTYLTFDRVAVDHFLNSKRRDILLPPAYFNPKMPGGSMLYVMPDFWIRCRQAGIKWPRISPYNRVMPYTIGCHLSKNSWL
ncbi:MAG: glycosyltransferase family 32 protein [Rhizobiaceae bacterium]